MNIAGHRFTRKLASTFAAAVVAAGSVAGVAQAARARNRATPR